jgi:hypothetical protein
LIAHGIFLAQLDPANAVVNLPASNVGVGKMTNEKFAHDKFIPFYHQHLGKYWRRSRAAGAFC